MSDNGNCCLTDRCIDFIGFTVQSSRVYRSADSSGAYVVSFDGSHVDITRYTAETESAGLNLSYTVSGVCAYHGKIVVFCNEDRKSVV